MNGWGWGGGYSEGERSGGSFLGVSRERTFGGWGGGVSRPGGRGAVPRVKCSEGETFWVGPITRVNVLGMGGSRPEGEQSGYGRVPSRG